MLDQFGFKSQKANRNQFIIRTDIQNIRTPKFKIVEMRNYDLSKITHDFEIADFERAKSSHHIKQIRASIVNNQFFDNVIRTVLHNGKRVVIDGQHRLAALYLLHKDSGLLRYDLVIVEYDEDQSRTVYRKINCGKRLSVKNQMKALDNNRIPFFNKLRDILCHDDGSKPWSFKEALECHFYSIGKARSLAAADIESALMTVSNDDIEFIRKFEYALGVTSPTKTRGLQFRPLFVKNTYAAASQLGLGRTQIISLIENGIKDKQLTDRLDNFSAANYRETYEIFLVLGHEVL